MIERIARTGSTNADLLARLSAGEDCREGHWLVADRQDSGRGRLGRDWIDGAGNFMGSTVVKPGAGDPPPATLAFVAGLAVHRALEPLLEGKPAPMLKWPNDVLVDRAKVAGVLLEAQGEAVVVGVGVNLAGAPDLPDRKATSLAALGIVATRDTFADALALTFSHELQRWRGNSIETLLRRWTSSAHPVGTALTVETPGATPRSGTFDGLGPDGALRLRLTDDTVETVHAGDVMLAAG